MDSPVFLTDQQVLELHVNQIDFFSGQNALAQEGLLKSAVAAPINYYIYNGTKNLFDLAACYAFHIVKNHPFIDGNKRAALAATLAFLAANGMRIQIKQPVLYKAMMGLASSKITMLDFSKILSNHSPLEFEFVATLFEAKPGRAVKPSGHRQSEPPKLRKRAKRNLAGIENRVTEIIPEVKSVAIRDRKEIIPDDQKSKGPRASSGRRGRTKKERRKS